MREDLLTTRGCTMDGIWGCTQPAMLVTSLVLKGHAGAHAHEAEELRDEQAAAGDESGGDVGLRAAALEDPIGLVLRGQPEEQKDGETGELGRLVAAGDPEDEADERPEADGAEDAVLHAEGAAGRSWPPVMPKRRSRPAYSARAASSASLPKSGQYVGEMTISA